MDQPLGVGLVGTGGFGAFCLEAFAQMQEVVVVAVADLDQTRAAAVAPPRAAVYGDFGALLQDPRVDIVAVNTPPALHAAMAIAAAEAGKHIFLEKPLATSLDEARAVLEAVQRAGVQATVDYVLRFHPLHQLAQRIAHTGAFGPVRHFALHNFATDETLLPGHWFWDPALSGGIQVEHGVHFIDICNQLMEQPPEAVCGFAQQRSDGRTDRVSAMVRYGDDALATFYHSFDQIRAVEQTTIRVDCARGHLTLPGWIPTSLHLEGLVSEEGLVALQAVLGPAVTVTAEFSGSGSVFAHGGTEERLRAAVTADVQAPERQADYRRAIQAGIADLVAAIRGVRPLTVTLEDGLASLAVALAATESAAAGACVRP